VIFGVPGMVMLARFVPWGVRDVEFEVLAPPRGKPLSRRALVARAGAGGLVTLLLGVSATAAVAGLGARKAGRGFLLLPALAAVLSPSGVGEWITSVGLVVLAGLGGLATAATLAARRGIEPGSKRE
jgi:PAT family beta-lactamase induction signal transducer AmpG